MELESYNEGTILYIGVEKGQSVPVEGILAIVGKEGEDYKSLLKDQGTTDKVQAAPKNENEQKDKAKEEVKQPENGTSAKLPEGAKVIRMPLLSDTMTEGKIVQWNKNVGDKVKSDDVLAEVETDKATMEVVGYEDGTLLHIGVKAGEAAKINEIIAIVGKEGTNVSGFVAAEKAGGAEPKQAEQKETETTVAPQKAEASAAKTVGSQEAQSSGEDGRIKASPLAKKLAAEKGIDIAAVQGTGDGGRIVKKDIDSYVPAKSPAKQEDKKAQEQRGFVQPFEQTGQESFEDIPNTQMRKTIARRLGESKFQAPHFYLTMEMNMDNAISSRNAINEVSPVKVSFNDIVIKACAMALRQHPAVNSSWMGDFIRQNKHIHIGSAVAMPEGLIVPVIRFADQKSLSQIAADAKALYDKARNKKLQPEEFSGNTFTVSNLGMMDIEEFTAIINPPDSAILAVGRIREIVVKKGDGFGVANVMKVTLSCDHRSVDGAVGAAFLQTVKKFLENPVTMLV
ncbi:MAG: pyruvate dehydrogenase complex dihydrolipoamide acetyltransferase, partial [Ginsengibacter sp.]